MRRMDSSRITDQHKVPPPKSIKEVPSYIFTLTKTFLSRLFYIYKLVWEAKKSLFFVTVLVAVIEGLLPTVSAFVLAELLNQLALAVTGELQSFTPVLNLLIINAVILILKSAVTQVYNIFIRISGELVSNHIKEIILNKSKSIDIGCYDLPDFHAQLENANREAGHRPVEILRSSFTALSTVIGMLSFIVVLTTVSWWAPLFIVLCSVPSAVVSFIYRRKMVDYMWRHSKERRQMLYYSETLVNKDIVKEVRMLGTADSIIAKFRGAFKKYFTGLKKLIIGQGCWNIAATLVGSAVNCFLLVFIAWGVYSGRSQIGDYSLYSGALNSIASGVTALISATATIYEGTLFINNLLSYLDRKQQILPISSPPAKLERHCGHVIEFKNVSFRYPGTEVDVLKNIDLKIDTGETVVIVGLNGAGKTTLIKLLTRLYDPTEGVITFDGRDIREYEPSELYSIFGIIFQDYGKYAMTVAENIAMGQIDKGVVMEDVHFAADKANATDFITRMPEQFETPLMRWFEPEGTEPSIGQWQKIAIARAFYSDSDILILDEPTASLDPMAEQEIFNEFDDLRRGKTTIFVSHRLSSATTADKIVVLEYGKILEIGSHNQLMEMKGKYHKLFSTQAKRYINPTEK